MLTGTATWMNFIIWIFLLLKFCVGHYNIKEMMPIITIDMNNAGFHRELNYIIHFEYPIAGKDCEYYLEQNLPAAVYVNVDQLNDLVRLKKLKAIYPDHIDVEMPTEKSTAFSLLLFGTPKISDHIILPIHFRYHAPSADKYFSKVKIDYPAFYMKCPQSEGVILSTDPFNETSYCLENKTFHALQPPTTSPSKTTNSPSHCGDCDWRNLEYKLQANELIAYIPVGNAHLYNLVLYMTILVGWIGCILILYAINTKNEMLKIKFD